MVKINNQLKLHLIHYMLLNNSYNLLSGSYKFPI